MRDAQRRPSFTVGTSLDPIQIRIFFLRTAEFGAQSDAFLCSKDCSDVVLLMVGEEICLLSLIVQTRKVTSDMCDFPPQFARHTSTIARRDSAVFGGEQFRQWRIQISHYPPSLPLSALTPCVVYELLNLNDLVLDIASVNTVEIGRCYTSAATCVYVETHSGQQMLVHFTGQTKIQLTRHFSTRETASTVDTATVTLPHPPAYRHLIYKPYKALLFVVTCAQYIDRYMNEWMD